MDAEELRGLLSNSASYKELVEQLKWDKANLSMALQDSALSFLLYAVSVETESPILLLTSNSSRAKQIYEDLLSWRKNAGEVYLFPESEILPFERLKIEQSITQTRLEILGKLLGNGYESALPPIIVASLASLIQKTLSRETFYSSVHSVSVGNKVRILDLLSRWETIGYAFDGSTISMPGTMSRRGGILDIYPIGTEFPARIEFFGDEVESIRLFDPVSQRSIKEVDDIVILPAQEALPSLATKEMLESRLKSLDLSICSSAMREQIENDINTLMHGGTVDSHSLFDSLLCEGSVLEYLSPEMLLVVDRPTDIYMEGLRMEGRSTMLRQNKEKRGDLPLNLPNLQADPEDFMKGLDLISRKLKIVPWSQEDNVSMRSLDLGFTGSPAYHGNLAAMSSDIEAWRDRKEITYIVSTHYSRLADVLESHNLSISEGTLSDYQGQRKGSITLERGSLSEGWTLPIGGTIIHVLTDLEIVGYKKQRSVRKRRSFRSVTFLSDLNPGMYVVHVDHGIARFDGTIFMDAEGASHEYLVLKYYEEDKLYVPVDQLDRIGVYIAPSRDDPTLTRLGTQDWHRLKENARHAAFEIAKELLRLYAAREMAEGISFSEDTPWQNELEDSFPYVETQDQLDSIIEVKHDMESSKTMDRLVCGDVGYGKTEVALRAAFKAVMDGRQVAILVPTTVLAQQHFTTFSNRLLSYPVKVEMLSRFRTRKEQQQILQDVSSGSLDICIGTHRLLQKDVDFKDLGLVIVDEEQRFGVSHKERLKDMRREVDVLTLSATPIPRTLHMALAGIRDISTIDTPPEERLAIKTYVSEYSEDLIREAVLREMDRGGKVFFLHNRVRTIDQTAEKIRQLIPEADIAVAHGQMPEGALEDVMREFSDGSHDVLICTTIIEAGLDVPDTNTLIVDRADTFGLSQLYQLRGRVGRGSNRAYAYLMVPANSPVNNVAEKRLRTIVAANELGAGFRIAMRDLEIRGAGNLLGREQSGHIHAVGYDLYSQLLSEAVNQIRHDGEYEHDFFAKTPVEIKVNLPLSAFIPPEYLSDTPTRLAFYQRMARITGPGEINRLRAEAIDRFGPIPEPFDNLLYIIDIKVRCKDMGVVSIDHNTSFITIQLREPIAGAQIALKKFVGGDIEIGHSQVRVPVSPTWMVNLLDTFEKILDFKSTLPES